MRKKLVRVGNGLALIIDQALLRVLGVDRDTWLRMTVSDGRLIIEPMADAEDERSWGGPSTIKQSPAKSIAAAGPPRARVGPSPELMEARRLVDQVRATIPQDHIVRLFETRASGWRLHWMGVENLQAEQYVQEPQCQGINRRLRVCLEQQRAGASWDEAVDAALRGDLAHT